MKLESVKKIIDGASELTYEEWRHISGIVSRRFEETANQVKLDEGEAEYALEIAKARCEDVQHNEKAYLQGGLQSAFRLK